MRKKIVALLVIGTLVVSVSACGKADNSTAGNTTQETAEADSATKETISEDPEAEVVESSNKDFDGSEYSDMGEGEFGLINQSGSTLEGNDVVVYAEDNSLIQIGTETRGVDGSVLSYVYIDGMEADKEQMGDYQGSLDLSGEALEEGEHVVEMVQFENDDPSGTVTTYKSAVYTVK